MSKNKENQYFLPLSQYESLRIVLSELAKIVGPDRQNNGRFN
jgi:hypothetical protein